MYGEGKAVAIVRIVLRVTVNLDWLGKSRYQEGDHSHSARVVWAKYGVVVVASVAVSYETKRKAEGL